MIDDSFDDLIVESRVGWRNVTREQMPLILEQLTVALEIEIKPDTQVFHTLQKGGVVLVSRSWRMKPLHSVQLIEVMQFLYRRHPEIRVALELLIQPRGSGLLRSYAQEIGVCVTGEAVKLFSVVITVVTVVLVAVITVAGFQWPAPTHRAFFP